MQFGSDKCAYVNIERGKKKSLDINIEVNGLELNELEDEECYKYLGHDEDIGINENINKERVSSEYYRRVTKIWNSELYCRNKVTAHNTYALPILTPTFGILKWTKEELDQIDITTRKILTGAGAFHRNSDVDRLYCYRSEGGRGLNGVADTYMSRIISLGTHLTNNAPGNKYINLVKIHETNTLMRQSGELQVELGGISHEASPKQASNKAKEHLKKSHYDAWMKKPQHSFLFKSREKLKDMDNNLTSQWLTKSNITSHVEGYMCAIQEEEINTQELQKRRNRENENNVVQLKCRVCHLENESIQHLLACCPRLSITMYLPVRHNAVAKVIYRMLTNLTDKATKEVYKNDEFEIWWDTKVSTKPTVKHNKPDMLLWRYQEKKVFIIDIVVGLDTNCDKNYASKLDNYLPLSVGLKKLYTTYSFEIVPIVVGVTGVIPKSLKKSLLKIGVPTHEVTKTLELCQKAAIFGSVKIIKSAMKYT